MKRDRCAGRSTARAVAKCPTGIHGLDEITAGGLPAGRPTLVCGGAGCGKTLFGVEFLVRGAAEYGENGVFVSFEESGSDLAANVASLNLDLAGLVEARRIAVDEVRIERNDVLESGAFDLDGLFVRLGHAVRTVSARRVVLDSIESLFAGLPNPAVIRAELRRLFGWLKERGLTAVVTGERGDATLTRHGIEEYVSDCVIVLDHRVSEQLSTRRLRIAKYRGSVHGTDEYPFVIEARGIRVLPVTSVGLTHRASRERVPTGVAGLDAMLGGRGYYRGTTVLVSGTAGCGKTSIAAHFVEAACRRGERSLMFLFEESPDQLARNMRSIGIALQPWVQRRRLQIHAARPSLHGLELHLGAMIQAIEDFNPRIVTIDPISSFAALGSAREIKAMMIRLLDYLKLRGVTVLLINLTTDTVSPESTESEISSIVDTWLLLRDIEANGERNRGVYILKSRGMAHSNQIREFAITSRGVQLKDVYIGPGGLLTGSARVAEEARQVTERQEDAERARRRQVSVSTRRILLEKQIAVLQAELAAAESDAACLAGWEGERHQRRARDRTALARSRSAGVPRVAAVVNGRGGQS